MQIVLIVSATVLLMAGIVLAYVRGVGPATAAFGAGVLVLIFAFLSRFKRFKGFGIEAELWEQKQEEAAQLIEMLRSLSVVVSRQLVTLSARLGRVGTPVTRKELAELVDRLEVILSDVNVSYEEREKVKLDFHRFTAIDMIRPVSTKIDDAIERKAAEQHKVVQSFESPKGDLEQLQKALERERAIRRQKVNWDEILSLVPAIAAYGALERTIREADCLTDAERTDLRTEIADELADLHEWLAHRRLRRPEQWLVGDLD